MHRSTKTSESVHHTPLNVSTTAHPTGCLRCWPESADAAWKFRQQLLDARILIDESHFRVRLLRCPHCSQAFLSVFTELVDWLEGNDEQEWTLLPLTVEEAAVLLQQDNPLEDDRINALGKARRSLRYCFSHQENDRGARWSEGIRVGMHD